VTGPTTGKPVTLDHSLKPEASTDTNHVYLVTRREQRHQYLFAFLWALARSVDCDLAAHAGRRNISPPVVACHRPSYPHRRVLDKTDLDRLISVALYRLLLDNDAGTRLQNGSGNRRPFIAEHLRHPDFFTNDPCHHERTTMN
jgi:hypothetical protein